MENTIMPGTTPLISVVMPVFNGGKYLDEAIGSILGQTFRDFEFLIVNDGSTDASESIIQGYHDSRIRLFRQENQGIGSALRNGCQAARGKYIARMDADDISLPNRLEVQSAYLETHPRTAVLSCAVHYINAEGVITGRSFPYTTDGAIKKTLPNFNPVCHPGVVMRRDTYLKSIGYLDIQPFEDHILWLAMSGLGEMRNLPLPLLRYRMTSDSLSHALPPAMQASLFEFLKRKLQHDELTADAIAAYRTSYREATNQAEMARKEGEQDHQRMKENTASAIQMGFYGFLKGLRLPEAGIERIICSIKNGLA